MTRPIRRIDKEAALAIHSAAIAGFGGLDGVRDEGLLESAARPAVPDVRRGGAIPHSGAEGRPVCLRRRFDHPFADGNKRTATAIMGAFLRMNGCRFKPRHDELLAAMLGVAGGSVSFGQLADWLEAQIAD